MEYLTSADCAKKWNVSQRRVAIYCKEGRIDGAIMMGRMWMIPKSAEKPEDPRKTKKNNNLENVRVIEYNKSDVLSFYMEETEWNI